MHGVGSAIHLKFKLSAGKIIQTCGISLSQLTYVTMAAYSCTIKCLQNYLYSYKYFSEDRELKPWQNSRRDSITRDKVSTHCTDHAVTSWGNDVT